MKLFARSLLVCAVVLGGCVAPATEVVPAAGVYSLDGDFGATESGNLVTSDMETLGLDDSEGGFQPRVDLRWPGMHLSFSGMATDFSGEGVTEATIEIDGDTITEDAEVRTDLELADVSSMLTFDLVPGDTVELGLGVAVALLAVDLRMVETNGAGEIDTEDAFPVPLAAGRFGLRFGRMRLYAEVGYVDASIDEGDFEVADYELGASVSLFGGGNRLAGSLAGGWRGIDLDADYEDGDSDVAVDLTLDGPFIGFILSF